MPEIVTENYINPYGVHSKTVADTETGLMHTTHRQDYSSAIETVKAFEDVGNKTTCNDFVFAGSLPISIISAVQRKLGGVNINEAVDYILKNSSEYSCFLSSGRDENKIFLGN